MTQVKTKQRYGLTLDEETIKEVDQIAFENDRTRSSMMRQIVKEYLKENEEESK